MTEDVVSLLSVLKAAEKDLGAGQSAAPRTWATGFEPLDAYLGGGVRAGELVLLGGPQGLGKTTFALQLLRHVVVEGGRGLLFSFEHDDQTLLERFLAMGAAEHAGQEGPPLRIIRQAMQLEDRSSKLEARLAGTPGGAEALAEVKSWGDR